MATYSGKYTLTQKGEEFIHKKCDFTKDKFGNTLLSGKNSYILPYCDPPTTSNKIWTMKMNMLINTNQDLGNALISWYNKYGELFKMDANVIAAQTFAESGFYVWNYSTTGALGISQFLPVTAKENIITQNNTNYCPILMTNDEIKAITGGTSGELTSQKNKAVFHQNITDNPEIMIKAQFRFMKFIANKHGSLTSNVLFGYSRGPAHIHSNYSDSIISAKSKGGNPSYEIEGITYVYSIFTMLEKNFGYSLGMNQPTSSFDYVTADMLATNKSN